MVSRMPFPSRNEEREVRVFSDHLLRHMSTKICGGSDSASAYSSKKSLAEYYPESGFFQPGRSRDRTSLNAQRDACFCNKTRRISSFSAVSDGGKVCRSCYSFHPMADGFRNSFQESLDLISEVAKIKSGEKRVACGPFLAGSHKAATFESSTFLSLSRCGSASSLFRPRRLTLG